MKTVITTVAGMLLLLSLMLQFTYNQVIFTKLIAMDQSVNNFKEVVKQDGCISEKNEESLKREVAGILSCRSSDVKVDGDRQPLYRGKAINYKVKVPVKGLIAFAGFWGLSQRANSFDYKIDRYTTSEYIGR